MSAMEYIHTVLMLVNDSQAYDPLDRDSVLCQSQDVAHDIMQCYWDVVHRWSQRVLDEVENNNISWAEEQLIPNLRVSMAIDGLGRSPGHKGIKWR